MTDQQDAVARAGVHRLSGLPETSLDVRITGAGPDEFDVQGTGDGLRIRASTPAAALAGYAQFARRTGIGGVSRSGIRRVKRQPVDFPEHAVSGRSPYAYRVAYNLTVGGYTTPFFGWEEWERELDILAASGINAAHLTLGQEAVWLEAFREFGYSEQELLAWIVPPSHQAWQWLNNIQHFGGTSRGVVDRRVELARGVLRRMNELGITPILPGFSGTVPDRFGDKNPGAPTVPQGRWFMDLAGPVRPDWLRTDSDWYARVAERFYRTQHELFGCSGWWAVDLLHEGGKIGEASLADAARGVQDAMRAADPNYRWVIQAWGGNPEPELLDALDGDRLLVLDLTGESWRETDGYGGVGWAYGILPNYGGRTGLYGDLEAIATTPATLFRDDDGTGVAAERTNLVGLTNMAEGVANNPVVWDLFHDLTWTTEAIDLDAWFERWITARYGVRTDAAVRAWRTLRAHAYGPWRIAESGTVPRENVVTLLGQAVDAGTIEDFEEPTSTLAIPMAQQAGEEALRAFDFYAGTDSIVAAIPSLAANQASVVGPRALPYSPAALRPALADLIEAAETTESSETAEAGESGGRAASLDHDLVDVGRQLLADTARPLLARVRDAFQAGDPEAFDASTRTFLELIDTQDALLDSHPGFRLDTWVRAARAFGASAEEQAQLAEFAKRLLTCWGTNREDLVLAEYANRDWSGLVGDYYRKRWSLWFDQLRNVLTGSPTTPVDWYAVAEEWVRGEQPARERPEPADVLAAARTALAFVERADPQPG